MYPPAVMDYLQNWQPQPKEDSEIVSIFRRDFYDDIQTKLGLNFLNYQWFNNIIMNQKHTNIRIELKKNVVRKQEMELKNQEIYTILQRQRLFWKEPDKQQKRLPRYMSANSGQTSFRRSEHR